MFHEDRRDERIRGVGIAREDKMVTKKSSEIPPFIVMEVMEKAASLERQGENIIHLEVGEPDFDTPECIKEAAIRAIREGKPTTPTAWGWLSSGRRSPKTTTRDTGWK